MPKDDANLAHSHSHSHTHNSNSTNSAGSSNSNSGPLRRGDACLYCRKRRIKCSADKPSCAHCKKLGRTCEYDSGKPVSRVRQLEEKVAQLENLLTKNDPNTNTNTNGRAAGTGPSTAQHPPLVHHSSSDQTVSSEASATININEQRNTHSTSNPSLQSTSTSNTSTSVPPFIPFSLDINMLEALDAGTSNDGNGFLANFGGSMLGGMDTSMPMAMGTGTNAADLFDFSLLDPGYTDLLSSFSATTTTTSYQQSNTPQPQPLLQPQGYISTQNQYQQNISASVPASAPAAAPAPVQASEPPLDVMDMFLIGQPSSTPFQTNSFFSQAPLGMVGPNAGITGYNPYDNLDTATLLNRNGNGQTQQKQNPDQNSVPYHAYVTDVEERSTTGTKTDTNERTPLRPHPDSLQERPGDPKQWIFGITDASNDVNPAGVGTSRPVPQPAEDPETFTLVGGWFDAADLPKVARDHLLDIFFSHMRMFGQEFHIPRFYASLSLPPAKRPHPCLLYSMYLIASRISTSPSIRALEQHFYSICCKQLDESIGHADRLLDATRAATILAAYKYSLARYHEGWMMTGQAARLAISCGLHQIKSSVFKPSTVEPANADLMGMMRHRVYVLPPPKDAIDHAERIWAFWSVFTCDRAGSISSQWPCAMPDETISTPYPKPFYEYELGMVSEADDVSIASLYDSSSRIKPLPHYLDSTNVILRMKALALLERSSKLMYLRAETEWDSSTPISRRSSVSPPGGTGMGMGMGMGIDEYLFGQSNYVLSSDKHGSIEGQTPPSGPAASNTGWTRTAKIRTPKAYEAVRQALIRVELDLPVEYRINDWSVWDGKVQPWHYDNVPRKDLITFQFVIGCAWMFLFDVFSFNAENTAAVNVARRLTFTVRHLGREVMTSEIDVFIAMCWSFISKILIREVKRLQSMGDTVGAVAIEADVETLVQALKLFGQRYTISAMQAMRTERYRRSTWDQVKFMEKDTHDDDNYDHSPYGDD